MSLNQLRAAGTGLSPTQSECTQTDGSEITLQTGTTQDTFGAYVQCIASTSFASQAMLIQVFNESATTDRIWLKIAIGAATSEVDLDLRLYFKGFDATTPYLIPFVIAASSRIAMAAVNSFDTTDNAISIVFSILG